MYKRNNWTNEEVIALIKEMGLILDDNDQPVMNKSYEQAINECMLNLCKAWGDFSLPDDHWAAVAYNTEDKAIEAIGPHSYGK